MLRLPGMKRVIRYRASAVPAGPAAQAYLVIYELEFPAAADLAEFAERQHQAVLQKQIGRGSPGGSALKIETAAGAYYEQIGPRAGSENFVPNSVILGYTDPATGDQDAEFIQWCSKHVQDAVRILGINSATPYRITQLNKERMPSRWVVPNRYLTIYDIDTKGEVALSAAVRALHSVLKSDAGIVDLGRTRMQVYERITEPRFPNP